MRHDLLILRSIVVEDLINSYYFKSYSWFGLIFSNLHHDTKNMYEAKTLFCHSIDFCIGTKSILMTLPENFVLTSNDEK